MAKQIVMDRTGDTRHNFDAKNADALLKAEDVDRRRLYRGGPHRLRRGGRKAHV
jgi:hypothetical protein